MTDNLDANFFTDQDLVVDPYAYFDALRDACPVHREPHYDVMMVTGYDEAVEVYNDSDLFSACNSVSGPFPGLDVPLEGDDVSELIEEHRDSLPMADQIITFDPPKHTDHRSLLMRLITPKRLKENEEFMWRLADQQLDTFIDSGCCEFIREFAQPFALLVVADLMGVPDEDRARFQEEMLHRPAEHGVGGTDEEAMAKNPLEFLYDQFSAYVEDRRANPAEDVLTGLASARFPDGSTPEVLDVVRIAANVFAAGTETTVRLLSTMLRFLAEDPALQQRIRADRSLIPNFVEETLRIESPVKGDFRLSRRPTTVGGVDLAAGTTVMVLNGAANRDPSRFNNPHTLEIERDNARHHMAFGRGVHTCPGAPLARSEARISLERILDRTADIRVDESVHGPEGSRQFSYIPTFILRGLTHLGLEFDPVEAPPR